MRSFFTFAFLAFPLVLARSHSLKRSSCIAKHGSGNNNPSSNNSSAANQPPSSRLVSAAWYTGWHATDFPLDSVSWDKYTHMTYAFAVTTSDGSLSLADSDEQLLPTFVQTAHQKGVKALCSIGGWTGSLYYSSAVGSDTNRTAFVKTVTNFATKYQLDGIDFDWEYPGTQGIGCNVLNSQDTTNFLQFLQLLRADPVGKNLILTAATSVFPWVGPTGTQLTDVSGFANQLDWVALMNYDIWGSWSTSGVGPNSPLNDTCASPDKQQGSAVTGVAKWHAAGFPMDKIVLGIASYGHSFDVTKSNAVTANGQVNAYPPFDASNQPKGDKWDDTAGVDVCGAQTGPGGNYDFWALVDSGFLTANGTAAPGIDYRFDDCSKTAYVYNENTQVMVSFDDASAMAAKGNFIKTEGLRGWAMWEAGGDYKDILLDSIRGAAGAN